MSNFQSQNATNSICLFLSLQCDNLRDCKLNIFGIWTVLNVLQLEIFHRQKHESTNRENIWHIHQWWKYESSQPRTCRLLIFDIVAWRKNGTKKIYQICSGMKNRQQAANPHILGAGATKWFRLIRKPKWLSTVTIVDR